MSLRRLALGLVFVVACTDPVSPPVRLNRCTELTQCGEDNHCDRQLGICVRNDSEVVPYQMLLQIVPRAGTSQLITRFSTPPQLLTGARRLDPISVPSAVTVTGQVLSGGEPEGLEAELLFTPSVSSMFEDTTLSVLTTRVSPGRIGFTAALQPSTRYDVRVRPLGEDANGLPPHTFRIDTSSGSQQHDFVYEGMQSFTGVLQDRDGKLQAGRKVLLRSKLTSAIVSSLGRSASDGAFTLRVTPEVVDTLLDHELEVGLPQQRDEWRVTITVDGSRLANGGTVTVPVVPPTVLYSGRVERQGAFSERERINASVTFSSRFDIPRGAEPPRGVDWCLPPSSRDLVPPYRCSSTVTAPVDPSSRVQVALYPGYYDIYVTPSDDPSDGQRVATTAPFDGGVPIRDGPDGGTFAGQRLALLPVPLYEGIVSDELQRPMPSVRVIANALRIAGSLDPIARFNRTTEALSGGDGDFKLPVDTGYYDLVATPAEGSGYPWWLLVNRQIEMAAGQRFTVEVLAPVVVRGSLVDAQGRAVPEARVDAFAIVRNVTTKNGTRRVRIATTTSDDAGTFLLHLPPGIDDRADETTATMRGMDGGVALDASLVPVAR